MTNEEKTVIMKSVISAFCVKGMTFTSVEISNHLKRLGVWIPNRVVAKFLRKEVVDIAAEYGADYNQAQISVDNGSAFGMCNCYYNEGSHPNDYMARDLKAITPDQFKERHGFNPFERSFNASEVGISNPCEEVVKKDGPRRSAQVRFNFPSSK